MSLAKNFVVLQVLELRVLWKQTRDLVEDLPKEDLASQGSDGMPDGTKSGPDLPAPKRKLDIHPRYDTSAMTKVLDVTLRFTLASTVQ
jgi:hypothetical protein